LLASGTCACGRSLPRLREITGCSGEHLRLANGREVTHGAWFRTLKEIEEIREFPALESARRRVVPRLVTTRGLREESEALIHRDLTRVVGSETELSVEETPEIPLSPVRRLRRIIPWEKMAENEREV